MRGWRECSSSPPSVLEIEFGGGKVKPAISGKETWHIKSFRIWEGGSRFWGKCGSVIRDLSLAFKWHIVMTSWTKHNLLSFYVGFSKKHIFTFLIFCGQSCTVKTCPQILKASFWHDTKKRRQKLLYEKNPFKQRNTFECISFCWEEYCK